MGKKYKRSPIIEALCEIQFGADSAGDFSTPGRVYDKVKDIFPKSQQPRQVNVGIFAVQPMLPNPTAIIPLMQFLQEDEKTLMQVGTQILAVNRLKPYTSWAEFLPLIEKAFKAYSEVVEPKSIHRITLRYINRIEFPAQALSIEQFFGLYPYIGASFPEQYSDFSVGVQFPYEDEKEVLGVQLTSVNAEGQDVLPVILDLSYQLLKPETIAVDEVLGWVNVAHDRIEQTFEASIKDPLRQMFEEATS